MAEKERTLRVEAEKSFLSSESRVFKTEQFIKETRRMSGTDDFLFKIAEGVLSSLRDFSFEKEMGSAYFVSTEGGEHSFLFRFGCQIESDLPLLTKDIVFFRYIDREKRSRTNDQRFIDFLLSHKHFLLTVRSIKDAFSAVEFKKIYRFEDYQNNQIKHIRLSRTLL